MIGGFTPPDVLGIIDDHWFKYVTDFGRLGPDKNKGGKFLIAFIPDSEANNPTTANEDELDYPCFYCSQEPAGLVKDVEWRRILVGTSDSLV